jgi:lipopolysaccharide biosynthesis glycosyltransferase
MTAAIPHVVWHFDAGFRACSLVSLHSVLAHARGPVQATLHPTEAMPGLEEDARRIAERFPGASVTVEPIDLSRFAHVKPGRWPLASRSRLLLPEIHDGRLIYLDGDTLVRHDIAGLWATDLKGACIGAALAPGVTLTLAKAAARPGDGIARRKAEGVARRGAKLDGLDMARYFNAGVVLMDLDRIRQTGLAARMADIEGTSRYTSRDQDWLNMVFRDATLILDPTWNATWGNPRSDKAYLPAELRARFRASREDPAIVHFTGGEKPWQAARPPFRLHLLLRADERRARARFWADYQTARAAAEAALGRRLWP